MLKQFDRKAARARRHRRVRVRLAGTGQRPRLSVFRSLHHVYAQLKSGKKDAEAAAAVGRAIAEKAKAAGVTSAVFDRGGFLYHGRVKALADAAREAGLEF